MLALFFAALNFADVETGKMSRATALASTAQQLSQRIGVAFGALLLNLTLAWCGRDAFRPEGFWPGLSGHRHNSRPVRPDVSQSAQRCGVGCERPSTGLIRLEAAAQRLTCSRGQSQWMNTVCRFGLT